MKRNRQPHYFLLTLLLCALTVKLISAQDTATFTDAETGVAYTVELHQSAYFPVSMVFAPDGRLFFTEKISGNVRVMGADGVLQPEPVLHLAVSALQERGMLGIALDPAYEENGYIWIVYTAAGTVRDWPANNLARFREENGVGYDLEIFLSVPIDNGELIHNGGNVHFDDEGYLYLSIGDYNDATNGQDLSVMQAKIHRFAVTDEGLVPAPGNPFEDNSTYAYGLRNSFDFTFDPISGNLFATENGLHCDDEINLILPRFNYGWSETYECVGMELISGLRLYAPPLLTYTPPTSPTGIIFYNHPAIPEWQGDMFFCSWNFGTMHRAVLNEGRTRVEAVYDIDLGDMQCRIDITVGPEGALYFTSVEEDMGGIYRLSPVND